MALPVRRADNAWDRRFGSDLPGYFPKKGPSDFQASSRVISTLGLWAACAAGAGLNLIRIPVLHYFYVVCLPRS